LTVKIHSISSPTNDRSLNLNLLDNRALGIEGLTEDQRSRLMQLNRQLSFMEKRACDEVEKMKKELDKPVDPRFP
jgi:hypothetical protein